MESWTRPVYSTHIYSDTLLTILGVESQLSSSSFLHFIDRIIFY